MSKPFRSDKRRKELLRLKKQEEKRLRRFGLKKDKDETGEEGLPESEAQETQTDEAETEVDEAGVTASENSPSEK